jgi:cyclophilin family peptidyl-prolyl cis-trans isomerase
MPSRSRDRQLAKLAARRQAERRAARRRRSALFGGLATGIAVLAIIGALFALTRNKETASNSPTPSTSSSPSGTVACDATKPKDAGEKKPTFKAAPTPADVLDSGASYTAVVQTSCGEFEMKLLPESAPKAVASFVFLARKHFFDGLIFHRIVPNFVIQGGDPQGSGQGGPGYSFANEIDKKLSMDHPGVLAMAHSSQPNSNGSQWFVTIGDDHNLDGQYTIFGSVSKGLSVVQKIGKLPVGGASHDTPQQTVYMERVTIEESKPSG